MQPQLQLFCEAYIRLGFNGSAAALAVGICGEDLASRTASRWLANVEVRRWLIAEGERRLIRPAAYGPRQLTQDLIDIISADPNDLVQNRVRCCRHCHGVDHAFQWRDAEEFAEATERALRGHDEACTRAAKDEKPMPRLTLPSMDGGFDFDQRLAPVDECPKCLGDGVESTHIADTRTLSGSARKLYAGVKRTKDGVQILMHDQLKAREMLAKMWGMINTKVELTMPGGATPHTLDEFKGLDDAQMALLEDASATIEANRKTMDDARRAAEERRSTGE